MQECVYLNGGVVPGDEARISVFDAGLLHGAGLFETFRTYGRAPFRLDAHLARMRKSAATLELPAAWDDGDLERGVQRVLQANELADARVRITVTAGDLHAQRDDGPPPCTTLITATKVEATPPEHYRRGMTVCLSDFRLCRHDPLAGHKTLSYLARLRALREAQRKQCGEALWFTEERRLAEGCISSVFLVRGGLLLTPPIDTPALPGVTRAAVLELAAAQRIASQERPLTIDDVLAADELFLTNSIFEVMPVCRVERHAVGDEKPGEITRRLHEAYRDLVWKECRLAEET